MKKKHTLKNSRANIFIHLFFIVMSLAFIIPFIYVISISLSSEKAIIADGYRLWPRQVDFSAYKMVFADATQIIDSYKVTALSTAIGTFLGIVLMTMAAYPLSREQFKLRKICTFYLYFTMLFGGGLIPTYILCTQYLHLGNKFGIYIVLGLVNVWHIIIIRTFFKGLPVSLMEAAKIDGASEFRIFFRIVLPLSKPAIATIAVMTLLGRWNDWNTSLIYIQDPKLYSLQYLLQKILKDAEFTKALARDGILLSGITEQEAPTEAMRFAMAVVATGPMFMVFPFFQKYFVKGLTVGAVKG